MSNAGRKPIPTEIKIQHGTFRADQSLPDEIKIAPVSELPQPPEYMIGNDYAIKQWVLTTTELHKIGILVGIDLELLAIYCIEMATYIECKKLSKPLVIKARSGYQMPNPNISIGNKALGNALKIAPLFGITPSARTRIAAPKATTEDGWDKMLRQKKERMAQLIIHPMPQEAKQPKQLKQLPKAK